MKSFSGREKVIVGAKDSRVAKFFVVLWSNIVRWCMWVLKKKMRFFFSNSPDKFWKLKTKKFNLVVTKFCVFCPFSFQNMGQWKRAALIFQFKYGFRGVDFRFSTFRQHNVKWGVRKSWTRTFKKFEKYFKICSYSEPIAVGRKRISDIEMKSYSTREKVTVGAKDSCVANFFVVLWSNIVRWCM